MNKAQIIEQLYTSRDFNDVLAKMEPDHLREDLKQEVILIVCQWDEEKIIALHTRGELGFYVVRVILNQVKSKSSPFAKKYRGMNYELTKDVSVDEMAEAQEYEVRLSREELEDAAINGIEGLYWYDAELIKLYLKLGNFRAMEKATRIPFISCYKNIKKSLATLKERATGKPLPIFSKGETQFINENHKNNS